MERKIFSLNFKKSTSLIRYIRVMSATDMLFVTMINLAVEIDKHIHKS